MAIHQQIRLIIEQAGFIVEYVGISIVLVSILIALVKVILPRYSMGQVRHQLATRIIFGLEFIIAADIVLAAIIVQSGQTLQLFAIVLIRVVLGYSLRKEAGLK